MDGATLNMQNGTVLVWQLPPASPAAGVILLAHGCRQSARVWPHLLQWPQYPWKDAVH